MAETQTVTYGDWLDFFTIAVVYQDEWHRAHRCGAAVAMGRHLAAYLGEGAAEAPVLASHNAYFTDVIRHLHKSHALPAPILDLYPQSMISAYMRVQALISAA